MSHKLGDLFRHHKGADHRTDNWQGHRGRVDEDFLERAGWPRQAQPRIYVCGPTAFVEAATSALTENGQRPDTIRTERFGPTGG